MIELIDLAKANQTHLDAQAAKHQARTQREIVVSASCPNQAHADAPPGVADALYVASNLKSFYTDDPSGIARDLGLNGTCYRRLDPVYHAWLRGRITKLQAAEHAGKLPAKQVSASLAAFREIHAWAATRFGQTALEQAVKSFRPRANLYKPPSMEWLIRSGFESDPAEETRATRQHGRQAYRYPPESEIPEVELPFWTPVPEGAPEKVAVIEKEALALGWTRASLFQNRGALKFPTGQGYGLVCFVKAKDRIEQVTRETVDIIKPAPSRSVLKFRAEEWRPQTSLRNELAQ